VIISSNLIAAMIRSAIRAVPQNGDAELQLAPLLLPTPPLIFSHQMGTLGSQAGAEASFAQTLGVLSDGATTVSQVSTSFAAGLYRITIDAWFSSTMAPAATPAAIGDSDIRITYDDNSGQVIPIRFWRTGANTYQNYRLDHIFNMDRSWNMVIKQQVVMTVNTSVSGMHFNVQRQL